MANQGLGRQGSYLPPPPPCETLSRPTITFCHPGYNDDVPLVTLPRVDTADQQHFGVHHRTALVACQIIACNRFDEGYLSLTEAGSPVTTPLDGVLTGEIYYFIIDGCEEAYSVVPSFRDWEFPHRRIPKYWLEASMPAKSTLACAITNTSWAVEGAHLVPKDEGEWYKINQMHRYANLGTNGDIDPNPRNVLPLRRDIHACFDKRWFAVVPKPFFPSSSPPPGSPSSSASASFVTHVLSREASELWPRYHYVRPEFPRDTTVPYVFARFAWAILLHVKTFLVSGVERRVTYLKETKPDDWEWEPAWRSGAELRDKYGGGGRRGARQARTPTKRRRGVDGDDITDANTTDTRWVYETAWLNGEELYRRYGETPHADDSSGGDDDDDDQAEFRDS